MDRRSFVGTLAGGLMIWPLLTGAQSRREKIFRIGWLGSTSATSPVTAARVNAFRQGMRELGYVEGRNLSIEFRWAEGNSDRLPALAAQLVGLKVDVIVTAGTAATTAVMQATRTIPVVMAAVGDAVAAGLVANLARPGGNVTGSTFLSPQLTAKRLELLSEVVPTLREAAILLNSANPSNKAVLKETGSAAKALKIGLQPFYARGPEEFEDAFAAMVNAHIGAFVTNEDPVFVASVEVIAKLAARQTLPGAMGRDFAEAGGLIGYGVRLLDLYRRCAVFVDKILKGAKPDDLPVEQATRFELVLNMKSAKTMGIAIPQSLFLRADEVIQ